MSARPYAVQMQRVLGSVAARVDPSIHPLLDRRASSAPDSRTLVIVVTGDKGLCGSFNTNVIKARRHVHRRQRRSRARSAWSAARAATSSAAAASTCCSSRSASSRSCASRTRRRSRRPRSTRSSSGQVDRVMLVYNEFKSVMTQRVVVDQLLPIARARRRRRRGAGARAPAGESPGRLPVRAVAAGDLQPAAAALRRGAGLPRAARVERRVLRRADDRDGHGDEELGRHDRAA